MADGKSSKSCNRFTCLVIPHYVTVRPGNFIFGDSDGVQLIPREMVDEVLVRVEDIYEEENEERRQIAEGMPIDKVYEAYGVL